MWEDHEREIIIKSRKARIPGMEAEDIAQELRIALWKKLKKFDPSRASEKTYANLIMESCIKTLGKASKRKCRYHQVNSVRLSDKMDIVDDNAPNDFASRIIKRASPNEKIWR